MPLLQIIRVRWEKFSNLLLVLLALFPLAVFSQTTQTTFGQNRVQYKDFTWSYFETEKFVTYFYLGGQDIGKFVIEYAEKELPKVEELLEYRISRRIEILVYNDLSDLNQTNIGQSFEMYNVGGMTKVIENKMFVYFDGNHEHLKQQIRKGIAQIFINHILFGGNLQEILQNAVLLNLPKWYTDGLADYVGEDWSTELDNKLRDGILAGKYKKFNRLTGEEAKFAGHAMWHYVEEKYGKAAVPNLLYLTRINRSMESGFLFVLGGSVKTIIQEWNNYYYDHFMQELSARNQPVDSCRVEKKPRKKQQHYEPKLSADGQHLAYAVNNSGRYRVQLVNYETGKARKVLKAGIKTITLVTDYSYPLISWSPDGKTLAVIYEKRDKIFLMLYNLETKDKRVQQITKFQQVHNFAFTDDPRVLVMSAANRGQSDIYTYTIPSTTVEQLTNDYHDDLEAGFVNLSGRRGILFLSNRESEMLMQEKLDTVLPGNKFDLFFYDLSNRSSELVRVTSTPGYAKADPVQINDSIFGFIADNNGIKNRYAGYLETIFKGYDTTYYFRDSIVSNPVWNVDSLPQETRARLDSVAVFEVYKDTAVIFPITNSFTNIIGHDVSAKAKKSVDMHLLNRRFEFFVNNLADSSLTPLKLENSYYQAFRQGQINRQKAFEREKSGLLDAGAAEETGGETPQEPEEFYFQSDFNTSPEIDVTAYPEVETPAGAEPVFKITRVKPYRVKFSTDYVLTQFIDNSIIVNPYQKFAPGFPVYNNQPVSMMINLGISDLFEDYRITGGFRLPYDFDGSEYFLAYESLRKRLDKRILYYRKVDKETYSDVVPFYNIVISPINLPVETKIKTNYFEYRLSYPFDVIKSLRWYMAYRHDNYVFLSRDDFSHSLPNYAESWVFAKMEYVHDNTVNVGLNLLNGIRFKVYAEIHKQILFNEKNIFNDVDIKVPDINDAYLGVFGLDFRYYQKVHKNIVWANRVAWNSSIGTRKMIYYLGGVDGWISPSFEQGTPVSQDNDYAFQALATNMRGFDQNVRNGNSYVVFNSELRIPLFAYLTNSTIKSELVKNFQIIGFTDIGTAWEGLNPWNKDNPLFTDVIGRDPVTVTVEYFKNPIVFGYGFGLRTMLLGYFIRMDVAWGNDSGIKTESPKLYFSFTTDF